MSDDSGYPPEAPLIDARSPAERWAEAGRAGVERLRERIDHGRLDTAGVWWMSLLFLYTAPQIYGAFRADDLGSDAWWIRATYLASSGGFFLVFGAITGVAVGALFRSRASRLTLRMALAAGTWVVLTGLLGVAVTLHADISDVPFGFSSGGADKIVSALGSLCDSGLGLVVAVLAWHLFRVRAVLPVDDFPAAAA